MRIPTLRAQSFWNAELLLWQFVYGFVRLQWRFPGVQRVIVAVFRGGEAVL